VRKKPTSISKASPEPYTVSLSKRDGESEDETASSDEVRRERDERNRK
jgi:hypothetical protein